MNLLDSSLKLRIWLCAVARRLMAGVMFAGASAMIGIGCGGVVCGELEYLTLQQNINDTDSAAKQLAS